MMEFYDFLDRKVNFFEPDEKFNAALNPSIYESAVDAVDAAIDMSKSNQQTYIIAQWFDEFDRH